MKFWYLSNICSHSLNMHMQLSSEAGGLKFSLSLHLIRIYHECEGRIEKTVPRISVWHHKACLVMTNSDPEV